MKKVNVKEFVKNHKKQIACVTIGVGVGVVGGIAVYKIRINSLNKQITSNTGMLNAIKNEIKEATTLRSDVRIKDAFMTVEYVDGDIGIIKDSTGVIEKLVDDGLMDVHQVAEALEYLTPKTA